MVRGTAACRFLIAGQGRLAVALMLLAAGNAAVGEDSSGATSASPLDLALDVAPANGDSAAMLGEWDTTLAEAVFFEEDFQKDSSAAPAQELAAGLDVQVKHKRRKFRARAVDWMADRWMPMGTMTDLLLGGAESGWHVVVDPSGTDEYMLEWKVKFR